MVSPVSGQVYERRLIEKFISDNGTDPINQEPLSVEQLIEIKCSPLVKPKPPSATSIPAILKSLQDEWDAVMLHSFTLRQQLQVRSQAYYCSFSLNEVLGLDTLSRLFTDLPIKTVYCI